MAFKVNQSFHSVFFCKPLVEFVFMFNYPSFKIIGHTNVECAIFFARKDIHEVLIYFSEHLEDNQGWIPACAGMTLSVKEGAVHTSYFSNIF